MDWQAFFTVHSGLPREGPGCDADIAWALARAGTRADARILDAGSGPGGDVAGLLAAAPQGSVLAVDSHAPFIDQLNRRFAGDPRVTGLAGDMMAQAGPFDLIWCAGAIYFVGVTEALRQWRPRLAPGGAVVFSQACLFQPDPPAVVQDLFEGMPVTDAAGIAAQVADAGYRMIAARPVPDAAWEEYYTPLEAQIASLEPGADAALARTLEEGRAEIAAWRDHRAAFGYQLCVARPA